MAYTRIAKYRYNTGNATTTVGIITQAGAITTTDSVTEGAYAEDQYVQVTHNGSSGSVYLRVIPETTAKASLVSSTLYQEVLTADSAASRTTEPIRVPNGYKMLILGSATIACNVAVYVIEA